MVRRKGTKSFIALALAGLMAMPWYATDASAITGTTNVTVTVPGSIILSYQSALDIVFTTGYSVAKDETGGTAATLTFANLGTPLSGSAGMATTAVTTAPTTMALTITNAWSTRSSSSTTVSIACGGACTATNGASTVSVSGVNVQVVSGGPAATINQGPAASITYAGPGMGLTQAVTGQIRLNMDISGVTATGVQHSGLSWTITATAI